VRRERGRCYLYAYHGKFYGKVKMCYLGSLKARSRAEVDLIALALDSLEQYAANAAEWDKGDRTAYLQLAAERLSAVGEEALLLAERLYALALREVERAKRREPKRETPPSGTSLQLSH
jgi:hypothetical protein